MSKNLLTDLHGIEQFSSVRSLALADNLLSEFEQLEPLQSLTATLEALSLEGNPLSRLPNYRAQVRIHNHVLFRLLSCNLQSSF